ncbi:MAG: hypothetical protein ABL966_03790 [Acidimicrobiales bacterium]
MRKALVSGLLTSILVAASVTAAHSAGADPALAGTASAYAATASVAGTELIPPTPEASATAPPFADDATTTIPLDVDPVAINGTLTADVAVHEDADLTSFLEQPAAAQPVDGPYNALALGQIEDLEVLIDMIDDGVSVLEADALRAEAVAVCSGNTVTYSASSEVVNLVIGGEDPLSGPLNDLITQITSAINASPLVDLLDIDVNVVTETADGVSVDALVVSVLTALDEDAPLVQVRLGHAEVADVTCGAAAALPQCSDDDDNDGDGVIDADDPGCHTDGDASNPDSYDPNDDDEADEDLPECSDGVDNDGDGVSDEADPGCHTDGDPDNPDSFDPNDDTEAETDVPECSDGVDNDGDGVADTADPECHTDGDATNPDSYDPNDDDEGAVTASALPRTGGAVPVASAAGLGLAALALLALRRRTA